MAKIGPSFPDELRAAGCTPDGYAWDADGNITFTDVSDDGQKKILAVLAAHDPALSEARHQALEATRAEAARRIAEKFLKPPDTFALVWKELNALARAVQILNKKIDGSALPEERLEIEVLDGIYSRVQAIRDAEDKATAALRGAKSVEEVEGVKVAWPKDRPESPPLPL